ncbi:hypothetical protein DMB42_11815 [Nonomuraea sp. WAC 01424]|nr:hypothetical protein DMB42_11815 [Nonomuraea sp. WAC 01424]
MACDACGKVYTHAIVLDSAVSFREQIRQAASRDGWKLTFDGRDVCNADAEGDSAFLIRGWTDFWSPEKAIVPLQRPPVMNGDDQQTVTLPAVVEPVAVPAGRPPYSPKDAA